MLDAANDKAKELFGKELPLAEFYDDVVEPWGQAQSCTESTKAKSKVCPKGLSLGQ